MAVLRHGAGSTASAVLPQARVLVDNGYGVLLTDARGHGSSSGTGMDFGWHGDADIAAALDFLTTQPEVDPDRIVVVGLSMGGEEAIGAAAADGRIAAVVAEGASARTEADKAWLADVYGGRGWVQVRLEWVQYTLTDLLTAASKPVSLADAAAVASPKPILMITAGNVSDEAFAARHVQAAAGGNVSVWAVPGADHIGGLGVAPEEWEETVITFLDSAIDGQT
jgi:pimeloyl-ACP methyl ester carboxylesterase